MQSECSARFASLQAKGSAVNRIADAKGFGLFGAEHAELAKLCGSYYFDIILLSFAPFLRVFPLHTALHTP